jgi:hypothetical protein
MIVRSFVMGFPERETLLSDVNEVQGPVAAFTTLYSLC